MFRNIVVGISGGVDSAITAFLLKERGYKVIGVFMRNWDEFDELGKCSGEQDLQDAQYACQKIGIELKQVNYVKEYWNYVFCHFLEDYQNGLTPNPDILCNKHIKFSAFYKHAIEHLRADAIATGHYAKTSYGPFLENYSTNPDVRLLIPRDTFKDQTFFLSAIKRSVLRRTMFPLGEMIKSDVKTTAHRLGLHRLVHKKESTGLCFVGNRNFKNFIKEYIHSNPGNFVDVDSGEIVGYHEGIHQWTVGQRCRLHSCLKPYFVVRKDAETNSIVVASGHDHPALWTNVILANQINWLIPNPFAHSQTNAIRCRFRFQHTKPLVECSLYCNSDNTNLSIVLTEPLFGITPGQYAVFYNETECMGSARIISSSHRKEQHNTRNVMQ